MFHKKSLNGHQWFPVWLKAVWVAVLLGSAGVAVAQPANDYFTNATPISGLTGNLADANIGAGLDAGEPTLVNYTEAQAGVVKSVWYRWTAPNTGVVSFDTFGSGFDTVLAVYTTNDPTLTVPDINYLVAANDDYIPGIVPQSYVTFTASKDTTYYISVNGAAAPLAGTTNEGSITLEWNETTPTIRSGNFEFTSDTITVSDRENNGPIDTAMANVPTWLGARVTVKRTGGSSGRVLVPYSYWITNNEGVAITNMHPIAATSGQLVFDDFQMSADIRVPVANNPPPVANNLIPLGVVYVFETNPPNANSFITFTNTLFVNDPILFQQTNWSFNNQFYVGIVPTNIVSFQTNYYTNIQGVMPPGQVSVVLGQPSLAPLESSDLMPPTALGIQASTVKVLSHLGGVNANDQALSSPYFYFERSAFRVQRAAGKATVYVYPSQAAPVGTTYTVNYAIDTNFTPGNYSPTVTPVKIRDLSNHNFKLQAGSDYAQRDPDGYDGTADFTDVTGGTLTWVSTDGMNPKVITIPITDKKRALFNEDFELELYNPLANGLVKLALGQIATTTVTILYDNQPAGAVDRTWNADGMVASTPPFLQYPGAQGGVSDSANGNGGMVYSVLEQPDRKAIIAGGFISYNSTPYNRIVRVLANGYPDPAFIVSPNSGANAAINSMALQPNDNKIIIAGEFTSFNGTSRYHIARLNTDGTVDTTFNPGLGADGKVWAVALQTDGKIVIGGEFQSYNGIPCSNLARLNADGSFDATYGAGSLMNGNVYALALGTGTGAQVYAAGAFTTVGGAKRSGLARFNTDGSLDTTFDPGIATYNPTTGNTDPINALAVQTDGRLLVGGAFSYVDMLNINGMTRFNTDGTLDTTFSTIGTNNGTYNPLTGIADQVKAITLQLDGEILIGGDFTTFNQTRRVGIARLYADGSVDTTFMDTAYNQFAGLINHYHNPDAVDTSCYPQGNHRNAVLTIAVEPGTTNVIIGGNFLRIGGGSYLHAFWDPQLQSGAQPPDGIYGADQADHHGIINNGRMDTHPRSNVARLVGGSTGGPGNIGMTYNSYSVDKSAGTLNVRITRANGWLGSGYAGFYSPPGAAGQQGIATVNDFSIGQNTPIWNTAYTTAWMISDGQAGINASLGNLNAANEILTINNNTNISGNLSAKLALVAPDSGFQLGGEKIPLGVALGGNQQSALTIIDDNFPAGTFSFSLRNYTVNGNASSSLITVTRTNGTRGSVQLNYATFNGTAKYSVNYALTTGKLTFADGETSHTFSVGIIPNTVTNADKTINLILYGITGGGLPGSTNAVLTIVNNNFANGHVAFAFATNGVSEIAGNAPVLVNRLGGGSGTIDVVYSVTNGTAISPVNFVATTNVLHWDDGDVTSKTINVPVIHDWVYTNNLTVNLQFVSAKLNSTNNANVLSYSTVTNTTLVITNVDFPGTFRFTAPTYSVKKSAGFAVVPVIRTGGSAGTVNVDFTTQVTIGTALGGVDYMPTNGTMTFTNGEVSKNFQVWVTNGAVSFHVTLTNSAGYPNMLGVPNDAVLNIIDTSTVNEPAGALDVTYNPNAGCNGNVYSLVLQTNNQLLVAGDFSMANGVPRQRIARLNADGSLDSTFSLPTSSMGANDQIRSMAVQTDGRILIGGNFSTVNTVVMNRIARLNYDGTLDSLFNPGSGADSPIYAVAETFVNGARKILVAGGFGNLNGVVVNGIGRMNDDGSTDGTFNAGGLGANTTVYAIAVQPTDGKIIIGGDFTQYNGVSANHIARLNMDGTLDTTFTNASASDSVRALAIQLDGRILAGGLFTTFNGNTNFNHIARLKSADGTTDTTFQPVAGSDGGFSTVFCIAVQSDNRIVLGGSFAQNGGVTRNGITRLNSDGTVDPTINFGYGADGFVSSVLVQQTSIPGYQANVPDEKLLIGGGFTHYNGMEAPHLARIYGGSMSGPGAFQFSAPTYSVNENGTNIVVKVIRTGGTSGTNLVDVVLAGGTALPNINYTNVSQTVTFIPGEVQQTLVVPVVDDMVITNDLTVNLSLANMRSADTNLPAATFGNQPTAVLTIINVDSAISFSSDTYLATKYSTNFANGVARIYVNRLGATYGTSTVIFNTTTNGSALAGSDYLAVTNLLLTFAPGISNQTVLIPIINGRPSGDQTVALQLSNITNSVMRSPSNAVLTIRDQTLAIGQLQFAATNYIVSEGGGLASTNAVITVIRTNGSSGIVTVDYATVGGTAAPLLKFTPVNGTLTFLDGQLSRVITVPIITTYTVEPTEFFNIQLANPTGGTSIQGVTNATVTVLNNNTGFQLKTATNLVSETNGTVTVSVLRYNNLSGVESVDFFTSDGTAAAGVNYTPTNGTLVFTNGASQWDITIPISWNTNVTGNQWFTISIVTNVHSSALIGTPSVETIVLLDADTALAFATNATSVYKNGGTVNLTVNCSNTNAEPVSVNLATADITAKAGVDYVGTNGTLVFSNGTTSLNVTIPIINNKLLSGGSQFMVTLSSSTGNGRIMAPSTNTVTILDSNSGLHFSSASYLANKSDGFTLIPVIRTEFTDTVSSVNFLVTNGTALAGINFVGTNGTLVFAKGATTAYISVAYIQQAAIQPDLTVLLQLSNPTNGIIDNPSAAVLTIHDINGSYVVPAGSQIISESGPVNGIIDSNETVTVRFAFRVAGGTNVNNLNATLLATNGVIPVGYTKTNFGPLVYKGHSAYQPFTFRAIGTNHQVINPTFLLQDTNSTGYTNLGLANFNYTLGSWTSTFSNTAMIVINDNTTASPYPSSIIAAQVGGSLLKATVTLNSLTHGSPKDVDALVVAPSGINVLIMAHAGSSGSAATNLVLTFDDGAVTSLPSSGTLTTGTNRPTQYYPVRGFN